MKEPFTQSKRHLLKRVITSGCRGKSKAIVPETHRKHLPSSEVGAAIHDADIDDELARHKRLMDRFKIINKPKDRTTNDRGEFQVKVYNVHFERDVSSPGNDIAFNDHAFLFRILWDADFALYQATKQSSSSSLLESSLPMEDHQDRWFDSRALLDTHGSLTFLSQSSFIHHVTSLKALGMLWAEFRLYAIPKDIIKSSGRDSLATDVVPSNLIKSEHCKLYGSARVNLNQLSNGAISHDISMFAIPRYKDNGSISEGKKIGRLHVSLKYNQIVEFTVTPIEMAAHLRDEYRTPLDQEKDILVTEDEEEGDSGEGYGEGKNFNYHWQLDMTYIDDEGLGCGRMKRPQTVCKKSSWTELHCTPNWRVLAVSNQDNDVYLPEHIANPGDLKLMETGDENSEDASTVVAVGQYGDASTPSPLLWHKCARASSSFDCAVNSKEASFHLDQYLAAKCIDGVLVPEIVNNDILPSFTIVATADDLRFSSIELALFGSRHGMAERRSFGVSHLPFSKVIDTDGVRRGEARYYNCYFSNPFYKGGKEIGIFTGRVVLQGPPIRSQCHTGITKDDGEICLVSTVIGHESKIIKYSSSRNDIPKQLQRFLSLHEKIERNIFKDEMMQQTRAPSISYDTGKETNGLGPRHTPNGTNKKRERIAHKYRTKEGRVEPKRHHRLSLSGNVFSNKKQHTPASPTDEETEVTLRQRKEEESRIMIEMVAILRRGDVSYDLSKPFVKRSPPIGNRVFDYTSIEGLLASQRILSNFANHCLNNSEFVPLHLRTNYLNALKYTFQQGEFDLNNIVPKCSNRLLQRGHGGSDIAENIHTSCLLSFARRLQWRLFRQDDLPIANVPDYKDTAIDTTGSVDKNGLLVTSLSQWCEVHQKGDVQTIMTSVASEVKDELMCYHERNADEFPIDVIRTSIKHVKQLFANEATAFDIIELSTYLKRLEMSKQFYLLLWKLLIFVVRTIRKVIPDGKGVERTRRLYANFSLLTFMRISPWRSAVLNNVLTEEELASDIEQWNHRSDPMISISHDHTGQHRIEELNLDVMDEMLFARGIKCSNPRLYEKITKMTKFHVEWAMFERKLLQHFGRQRLDMAITNTISAFDLDANASNFLNEFSQLQRNCSRESDYFSAIATIIPKEWVTAIIPTPRDDFFYVFTELVAKFVGDNVLTLHDENGHLVQDSDNEDISDILDRPHTLEWNQLTVFPGSQFFLKAIILDLARIKTTDYSDGLRTATCKIISICPDFLPVFIRIVFQKTSIHCGNSVFECLNTINSWFQTLYSAELHLPASFDDDFFFKGLYILLDSDIALNQQKTIWLIYQNTPIFTGQRNKKLWELVIDKFFITYLLTWAPLTRRYYIQLILFRLVEPIRKYLTDWSIRPFISPDTMEPQFCEPFPEQIDNLRRIYFKRVIPAEDELLVAYFKFCTMCDLLDSLLPEKDKDPRPLITRADLFNDDRNFNLKRFRQDSNITSDADFSEVFTKFSNYTPTELASQLKQYPNIKCGLMKRTIAAHYFLVGNHRMFQEAGKNKQGPYENDVSTIRINCPLPHLLHTKSMRMAQDIMTRDGIKPPTMATLLASSHQSKHNYLSPQNGLGSLLHYGTQFTKDTRMDTRDYYEWMVIVQLQRSSIVNGHMVPNVRHYWEQGARTALCTATTLLKPINVSKLYPDQNVEPTMTLEDWAAGAAHD